MLGDADTSSVRFRTPSPRHSQPPRRRSSEVFIAVAVFLIVELAPQKLGLLDKQRRGEDEGTWKRIGGWAGEEILKISAGEGKWSESTETVALSVVRGMEPLTRSERYAKGRERRNSGSGILNTSYRESNYF